MNANIEKILQRACTVSELIDALSDLPLNARVAFSSDYGDHCHTEQVHLIKADIEEANICESAYSDSGLSVDKDGQSEETIFIIS